jgi:ArsR family transcriptional regulator, arsenate/arsenite/antimonite-responsive transcriptional repressor
VDDSTGIEVRVARFRALADPTRLQILDELAGGTLCVCDLRGRVGVSGPLLSHHLAVLRDAGFVTSERRGRWIDYTLDDSMLTEVAGSLLRPPISPGADGSRAAAELAGAGR